MLYHAYKTNELSLRKNIPTKTCIKRMREWIKTNQNSLIFVIKSYLLNFRMSLECH